MTQTNNILGISLGTRTIGMAMIVNGELADWYIKAFKGAWSERKKDMILDTIERMLDRYAVTSFAIKIPNGIEKHLLVKELHRDINLLAQSKGITTDTFTIQALKAYCGTDVRNKKALRAKVLQRYPELKEEYTKEMENRNSYYTKLFEATLAANALDEKIVT